MKITEVKVVLIPYPGASPAFKWREGLNINNGFGSSPAGTAGYLLIETDEGFTGIAAVGNGVILEDYVNRRLRQMLLGKDPLDREYFYEQIWEIDRIERFPAWMLGIVDVALWDIAGKQANLPIYKLMGGYREAIPAYASTATYETIDEFLDVADKVQALGYKSIKLHAWGDAKKDAELSLALRAHVGDEMPLMYDGSAGFDLMDAVYLGDALSEANYLWYEEPMREFSVTAYKWLGERVKIPLLLGEVAEGAHFAAGDFLASGVASALRTSTGLRGGFTGAMRIAHLADAYHLRAEVHGGGLTAAHLCMAIKNTTAYESFISSTAIDRPEARFVEIDSDGMVHAPKGVGVGYEEEWKLFGLPEQLAKHITL